jgi:putative ABC transport system permease protein
MTWIRDLFARRALERDLAEEIRQHLDEKIDDLMLQGLSRDEASRLARREFGNVTLLEEQGRDVWRWPFVEDGLADLRYACRQLRRTPAFAFAAIATLALGIGASVAMFSVVNAVVLRPLPFPASDRLVTIESRDRRGPEPDTLSYPTFLDFRSKSKAFERIASFRDAGLTLSSRGLSLQLRGQIVSWDFFQTLGIEPAAGRWFLPEEESPGARVVVLSHETWTSVFGGDHSVIGAPVTIGAVPHVVVGIAPAGFNFPLSSRPDQIWTTLAHDASSDTVTPMTRQRGARVLHVVARLAPDIAIEEAHAQLDVLAAAIARDEPDQNKNIDRTYVTPALERLLGQSRDAVLVLWAAVSLLMLTACANVASLLLARITDREREFTLRLAIGGSGGRIIRQLVTENLVLAAIGCSVGVGVAVMAIAWLLPMAAEMLPRAQDVGTDLRVLSFTVALALMTVLLISAPAAFRVARGRFTRPLGAGARATTDDRQAARGVLVAGQVAVSLVLLTGATVLAASFVRIVKRDLGFEPRHLMTFSVSLPSVRFPLDRQVQFVGELIERLEATPGVTAASGGMPLPLEGDEINVSFEIEERPSAPSERPHSNMAIVTPGYFATIGAPVIAGRDFTATDDEKHGRVLVVNQAFAERFFPGQSAIGKRIKPGATSRRDNGSVSREIIGIVGNARQELLATHPEPIYYFPYKQLPWGAPSLVVRSNLESAALESSSRRIVAELDAEVPVHSVRSFEDVLSRGLMAPQLEMLLIGSIALIALLLTATGLYGILSYSVLRRTREIGVRVALGAPRAWIVSMVVRQVLTLVMTGIILGSLTGVAANAVLRHRLGMTGPPLAPLLALACFLMALTAAFASYVPARRAASIDPTEALRNE